jgi:hypothetical protein
MRERPRLAALRIDEPKLPGLADILTCGAPASPQGTSCETLTTTRSLAGDRPEE